MELKDELALSYYKTIGVLNREHDVFLVQHVQTNAVYVMKRLAVYKLEIFEKLRKNPVRNMPGIIELAESDGVLTVIEEYITGKTLEEVLKDRSLSQSASVSIAIQLCRIVRDLHGFEPPIIHRDIKPSNIIINNDGIVKLVDIDAAKTDTGSGKKDTVLMGTQGYAAPEQYGFGHSGRQTDIYAIGVVMAEMVHGSFSREKLSGSMWDSAVEKCTRLDPVERYNNVDDLLDDLEEIRSVVDRKNASGYYAQYQSQRPYHYADSEAPESKTSLLRSFLPPGFRSGKPLYMAIAFACYAFLVLIASSLKLDGASSGKVVLNRFFFFVLVFGAVLIIGNYRNVWHLFRIDRIKRKWLAYTVSVIISAVMFLLGVALMVLIEYLAFPT